MSTDEPDRPVPRELESELKSRVHELAAASTEELEEAIDQVEGVLDEYESRLEGSPDPSQGADLLRSVASSRQELEKLREAELSRRDAVGRIRLIMLFGSDSSRDS